MNTDKGEFNEFFDSISNNYSNYKYGFSIKFPIKWSHDKGFSEYTIIRGFQKDSAITFSINVIEINGESNKNDFSIWQYYDNNRESVENQLKKQIEASLKSKIQNYNVNKIYIDNHETLKRDYIYTQKNQDNEYQMRSVMYQIAKPPYIFTLGLQIPLFFFEENPDRYNAIINDFHFIHSKSN